MNLAVLSIVITGIAVALYVWEDKLLKPAKQWIRSKTAWVAVAMGSLPVILEGYLPEIKSVITEKLGTEWGVVYGVVFTMAMIVMRSVTTEPISTKGLVGSDERGDKKNVYNNGEDENDHIDSDGGDHRGDEPMDGVSETISDPAAGV